MAHAAISQGAAGVDMGRNIFQAEAPVAMIQAVRKVVHEGMSPEQRLGLLPGCQEPEALAGAHAESLVRVRRRRLCRRPGRASGNDLSLLTYVHAPAWLEPDLALHGGGNTSCKGTLANILGEEQSALFVKASGVNLATIQPGDFVALDLAYLTRLLDLTTLSDDAMASEFACHGLRPFPASRLGGNPGARRASLRLCDAHAIPAPFSR